MKTRAIAAISLSLAIAAATTGCSMISPQATTISYSPAEGVSVPSSGPVEVRNALIVGEQTGEVGNFLGALINDTDEAATVTIAVSGEQQRVRIPARTTVSLGVDGEPPLLFENLGATPGENIEMSFQSGDGEGVATSVPVLDGTLPYLAEYVPAA